MREMVISEKKGDGSTADDGWTPIEDRSSGTLVWVRRRNGSWWPGRILSKEEIPVKLRKPQRSGVPIKLLGREDGNIGFVIQCMPIFAKVFAYLHSAQNPPAMREMGISEEQGDGSMAKGGPRLKTGLQVHWCGSGAETGHGGLAVSSQRKRFQSSVGNIRDLLFLSSFSAEKMETWGWEHGKGWTPIEDRSPGTLVWVRRRNGSWWPGRILSKEEIPVKRRKHQRSAVPIKLLGREDGNVDWYNLDKSRRVKPFRCGEYDDCIEEAKIHGFQKHLKKYPNQGKYVRREDAILHALEIERSTARKASAGPTSSARPRQINGVKKKPSYGTYENASDERRIASKKKVKKPNDSEEDVKTEGMLRMRDLTEIGSEKEKPSKKKSESQERALENPNLVNDLNVQFGVGCFGMSTSSTSLTAKKKRSNMAQAYENMRKKQKSVPLSQICDGTRVIIPSYCDWVGPKASNKDSSTDLGINNKGPDSSETSSHSTCNGRDFESGGALVPVNENASSDGFIDVPLLMGDFYNGDLPPFSSYMGEPRSSNSNHETSNSQNNNLTPTGTLGLTEQPHEDSDAVNIPSPKSTELESNKTIDARPDIPSDSDGTIPEMEVISSGCNNDMASRVDSPLSDVPQYETVKPFKSIPMEPTLYDVEIKVEASYKGPRVPLVSLMSRLNGKAIVGHPVSVKVLKDGSTYPLISRREHHRPSTSSINQLLKRGQKATSGQRKGGSHKSSKPWKKTVVGYNSNGNNANKKAGFSPRKMRRLSSITIDRTDKGGDRKMLVEKVGGPRVACVPLRLVFSRINEALKFSSRLENP